MPCILALLRPAGELAMDVPQGLVFIFYMFVAFFAIGTILKGFSRSGPRKPS
jgi:hypothetical protein